MIKKFKKLTAVILSSFLVVSGVPANTHEKITKKIYLPKK